MNREQREKIAEENRISMEKDAIENAESILQQLDREAIGIFDDGIDDEIADLKRRVIEYAEKQRPKPIEVVPQKEIARSTMPKASAGIYLTRDVRAVESK